MEVEPILTDADFLDPIKTSPVSKPEKGTGLNSLMESARISALTENSGPDEIIEAISKFLAITANRDAVFLGIARSELIKKLKAINVQSPADGQGCLEVPKI